MTSIKPLIDVRLLLLAACVISVSMAANATCPFEVPDTRSLGAELLAKQGCHCDNNVQSCFNLVEIPKLQTGLKTTRVTKVIFEEGFITTVPSNSLPANLTSVTFNGNPLANISEKAFENSATTLNELSISDANFTRLPDVLKNLPSLTTFIIINTHIDDWNEAALQLLSKTVTELHVNQAGLKSWPSWLKLFTSLKVLDISKNDLGSLPDDAFSAMRETLTDLYLSLTGLTQLPAVISNLPRLQLLDLSRNIFHTDIDKPAVEQIATMPIASTLTTVIIRSMNLSVIPNFARMNNLATVDLSYNRITNLTSGRLPGNIQNIYLTSNRLKEISDANVIGYPKLTSLFVDSNANLNITPAAYRSLAALKNLDISSTNLDSFPENLTALVSIETLKMNNNQLPCICPHDPKLFRWFAASNRTVSGMCNDGQNVSEYLSGACQPITTTTATTTATTTPKNITNTVIKKGNTGDASAFGCSTFCRFACFFAVFLVYISID